MSVSLVFDDMKFNINYSLNEESWKLLFLFSKMKRIPKSGVQLKWNELETPLNVHYKWEQRQRKSAKFPQKLFLRCVWLENKKQ